MTWQSLSARIVHCSPSRIRGPSWRVLGNHDGIVLTSTVMAVMTHAAMSLIAGGVFAGGPIVPPPDGPDRNTNVEIIVRYDEDAPRQKPEARAWGAQCVDRQYRTRLVAALPLGARMWVVRIEPPVAPRVTKKIVRQLEECAGVEWAEIPEVHFGPGL